VLHEGDVLFNRTNSKELVGKCAVFHAQEEEYVFASYLIRIRFDKTEVDPSYATYVLNSPIGRSQIDVLSRQIIGQANINAEELRSLLLPLPPTNLQRTLMKQITLIERSAGERLAGALDRQRTINAELEELLVGS
jgi:type I restriction enzyme S subunit